MLSFAARRRRHFAITIVLAVSLYVAWRYLVVSSGNAVHATGYALFGAVVFLLSYHWRKQITYLPIGRVSTWLQLHIYAGFLIMPLYGLHAGFSVPNGIFETTLAVIFWCTTFSGIGGLYITRTFPRRLSASAGQYLFDRIPLHQHELKDVTRRLIRETAHKHPESVLADFYSSTLAAYFETPRSIGFQLFPHTRDRKRLMAELANLKRYLSPNEQPTCDRLFHLMRKKDDLDFQYSMQFMMRAWLFVHIALSYALIFASVLHVLLVHEFDGGWQ